MRILFITNNFPPGYTGGAEISNYHTCRGLMARGVQCAQLVLNNRAPASVDEWEAIDDLPVHRLLWRTEKRRAISDVFDVRVFRAVRAELRRLQPDLVHVHNVSGATLAPYVACRTLGVPVVNTLHDLWLLCPNNMCYREDGTSCDLRQNAHSCHNCFRRYDYWGALPRRRAIFKQLTANVRLFISPSQALIERHVEAGYPRERFRQVCNGFAADVFHAPRHPAVRRVVDTAHQYRTVVFAGGGTETKGAQVVQRALPLLLRHVDRLRVVVAGGGDEAILAGFRRCAPAVWTLGRVPFCDMRALFASADLTLVPSFWHENSPVTIFESFQVGTPVVGSNVGGIPELIREGETGYLVPPDDAVALAERIVLHFARPANQRRHMRWRCVQEAGNRLSLERHLDELQQVYAEVLGT